MIKVTFQFVESKKDKQQQQQKAIQNQQSQSNCAVQGCIIPFMTP